MRPFSFVFASLLVGSVCAENVPIAAILKSPAKYDRKTVSVKGTVEHFTARSSKTTRAYYLFKLVDKKQQLSVYGQGTLAKDPAEGSVVIVTGLYAHERKVGNRTYRDEIESTSRLDKKYGVVASHGK